MFDRSRVGREIEVYQRIGNLLFELCRAFPVCAQYGFRTFGSTCGQCPQNCNDSKFVHIVYV